MPSSDLINQDVAAVALQLAKRAALIRSFPDAHVEKQAGLGALGDSVKDYWRQLGPVAQSGLIGSGAGAVIGAGSSYFRDKKERHPFQSAVTGALAGGAAGLGLGAAQLYWPGQTAPDSEKWDDLRTNVDSVSDKSRKSEPKKDIADMNIDELHQVFLDYKDPKTLLEHDFPVTRWAGTTGAGAAGVGIAIDNLKDLQDARVEPGRAILRERAANTVTPNREAPLTPKQEAWEEFMNTKPTAKDITNTFQAEKGWQGLSKPDITHSISGTDMQLALAKGRKSLEGRTPFNNIMSDRVALRAGMPDDLNLPEHRAWKAWLDEHSTPALQDKFLSGRNQNWTSKATPVPRNQLTPDDFNSMVAAGQQRPPMKRRRLVSKGKAGLGLSTLLTLFGLEWGTNNATAKWDRANVLKALNERMLNNQTAQQAGP